jgi:hypothetical protein
MKSFKQAAQIFGMMVEIAAQLMIWTIYTLSAHTALHLIGV